MQKNWYILYTKPKCEKKVAGLLKKREIDVMCPLNFRIVNGFRKKKPVTEPLFESYVFVRITQDKISFLKQIDGVLSLLYWKGEPAIVKDEEVRAIKEFSAAFTNIKIEKNRVNCSGELQSIEDPISKMEGNILTIKNRSFKIKLPSMGVTLTAEIKTETDQNIETPFGVTAAYNLQS